MKFLRKEAAAVFIAVISVLCLIAACIAINTSVVMIKKRDQVIKPVPAGQEKNMQVSARPVKINKLEEQELYFNGRLQDDMKSYLETEGNYFIPIDQLLTKLGIEFKYFASDDMLEFVLKGKKITIRLNRQEFRVGQDKITLKSAVQAAKNHILIPDELLNYMDGFSFTGFPDKKSVFINYFPDKNKNTEGLKVLRLSDGVANISDIFLEKCYWKSRDEAMGDDKIESYKTHDRYIIKSLDKVFITGDGQNSAPKAVNVNPSVHWSANGRYLYWIDGETNQSFCCDVRTNAIQSLSDYISAIKNSPEAGADGDTDMLLYNYKQGKDYKRITFTDDAYSNNYVFLERKGKSVVKGLASYSPDYGRILYYEKDKGYYTVRADGSGKRFLGPAMFASWISNDRIIMYGSDGKYLVTADGRKSAGTTGSWKKLGETLTGDIFYTDGNMLYGEAEGNEVQLVRLVISCDFITAADIRGPYIAASSAQDKLYFINNGTIDVIGSMSQLLRGKEIKSSKPWGSSILTSTDGIYTAMARASDGFINIDFIDNKKRDIESLTLNCAAGNMADIGEFQMKWLKNDTLAAFTPSRGWLIKLEDDIKIYDWTESEKSKLEGILIGG